jgi:hypothetical protein
VALARSDVDRGFAESGSVDFDSAMREALSHESAEVLRHQIECERRAAVKMARPEVFVSFLLAGLGVGIGFAAASSPKRSGRASRRSR